MCAGITDEHRAVVRIVLLQQHFVGLHPHRGRDVVALGLADQRMEQQAVANFERRLLDVFVRAMGRVASLKGDDFAPSALGERGARLARLEPVFQEGAAGNLARAA